MTHSLISVAPIPMLGPVAARRKSGWSIMRSTSSLSSLAAFSCPMTAIMSFSRPSRAAVPRPVKCNFFATPSSAGFRAILSLVGAGMAVTGALPGTAPGGPRSGSAVRAGNPALTGDGLATFAVGGGQNSSDSPSTNANCFLSDSLARSKP